MLKKDKFSSVDVIVNKFDAMFKSSSCNSFEEWKSKENENFSYKVVSLFRLFLKSPRASLFNFVKNKEYLLDFLNKNKIIIET